MKYLIISLLLILLIACSSEDKKDKPLSLQEQIAQDLKFNAESKVQLFPSSTPGLNDIVATYPLKDFDVSRGTTSLTNGITGIVDVFLTKGYSVNTVKIDIYNNDVYMGSILIEPEEFKKIKASGLSIYTYVKSQMKLDQKFQVEVNIKNYAGSAKDILVEKINNATTNETIIDIKFKLKREPNLADWQKKNHPLYHIKVFELLLSDLIKLTFESDEGIDRVRVRSDIDELDSRWNNSFLIGKYEMDRIAFEEIVEKWDDLRYNIFEDIEYSPIFLVDYIAVSNITAIEFGKNTVIDAYYIEKFKSIDVTMDLITTDIDNLIETIFNDYKEVEDITINFKAKVPAKEGDITSDGIHYIVKDFIVTKAQRDIYETIIFKELTPVQTMFNYDVTWHDRASELSIMDNMFTTPGYFRKIEFSDNQKDVSITMDSCIYERDALMKGYIQGVKRALVKDDNTVSLEDEIYTQTAEHIRKLIFDFHPPYIETVNFYIEMVYLDTTGHEIRVDELGTLVIEKQEEALYWFQTEHPDELEWIIEIEDNLDIDDDEVLCQQ